HSHRECGPFRMPASVDHDAADAFTRMHQIEPLVDVGKRHRVGDHRINLDLAVHIPVDDLRHVCAAAGATESGAFPHPSGDELEGAGGDFGSRGCDADDD